MYSNFDSEAVGFISAMMGMLIVVGIISLAVLVLTYVAMWKMFEKAGEPGWSAIIPFYNAYVLFKISWGNGWYFLLSVIPTILYEIVYFVFYINIIRNSFGNSFYSSFDGSYFASSAIGIGFLMFILWGGMLAVEIILCIKLAKVFGQSGGFACGLLFVYPVFLCIIAFSKNIYYVGIPGKRAPYGVSPVQPNNQIPYYQPNGSPPQGYQNPYYQPQGNPQWGYQSPYYPPNANPQQGYQAPAPQQPNTQGFDSFNQQMNAPSGVSYCPECGTLIEREETVCPKCGKTL